MLWHGAGSLRPAAIGRPWPVVISSRRSGTPLPRPAALAFAAERHAGLRRLIGTVLPRRARQFSVRLVPGPTLRVRGRLLGQTHLQPLHLQAARFQRTPQIRQGILQQLLCLGSDGLESGRHSGIPLTKLNPQLAQMLRSQVDGHRPVRRAQRKPYRPMHLLRKLLAWNSRLICRDRTLHPQPQRRPGPIPPDGANS